MQLTIFVIYDTTLSLMYQQMWMVSRSSYYVLMYVQYLWSVIVSVLSVDTTIFVICIFVVFSSDDQNQDVKTNPGHFIFLCINVLYVAQMAKSSGIFMKCENQNSYINESKRYIADSGDSARCAMISCQYSFH